MASNLAATPKSVRMRRLLGKVARTVDRHRRQDGSFWWLKRAPSALDWAIRAYENLAPRSSAAPRSPALCVKSPGTSAAEPGLATIRGWAFSAERDLPEGIVEASLDGDEWVVLSNREPLEGSDTNVPWSRRCGFHAALNTFCLTNGVHRLRLRVKTRSGRVVRQRKVSFRVNHVGRLAEVTTGLLKNARMTKRIWLDLVDSTDFPFAEASEVAWFERPDAENQIASIVARHNLPQEYEAHLRHFLRSGYIVLDRFISKPECDQINRDLEALLATGKLRYEFKGQRIEKMFDHSRATRGLWAHPGILKLLSAIFDDQAVPCQTLNFIHGSQQAVHQDGIHLTPFPQGFMCGVWVALEDVHADSGPLVVYPGSHRLPRIYTQTVGTPKVRDDSKWGEFSAAYSPAVKKLIEQSGLEPFYYTPKVGSVLIWHENLAHGGSPRNNEEMTRKSIVSHYFARGAVAFYDSQGVPAWTHAADDD
jgi:Phytanoyl-CoA dioxygenase (PhyH)